MPPKKRASPKVTVDAIVSVPEQSAETEEKIEIVTVPTMPPLSSFAECINRAIVVYGNRMPGHRELAKFCGFSETSLALFDIFFDPAFNDSMIYLDRAMVAKWFCKNASNKSAVANFYDRILRDPKMFKAGIDYHEVSFDDPVWHSIIESRLADLPTGKNVNSKAIPANGTKFYVVTGECLKRIGMMTNQSVCDYYIQVEKFAAFEHAFLSEISNRVMRAEMQAKLAVFEAKVALIDQRAKLLEQMEKSQVIRKPSGWLYAASTLNDIEVNRFKVGFAEDLDRRLDNYNKTFTNDLSRVFYCEYWPVYDMRLVENNLKMLLKMYHCPQAADRKIPDETYIVNIDTLLDIITRACSGHCAEVEDINARISTFKEDVMRPSRIVRRDPPKKPLTIEMKMTAGNEVAAISFDISTMDDAQRRATCCALINDFVREKTEYKAFDITADGKEAIDPKIDIVWKEIEEYIRGKMPHGHKGDTKKNPDWKSHISNVLKSARNINFRLRARTKTVSVAAPAA